MRTVSAASVAAGQERVRELPASVQQALGEIAEAAMEGLLALSVGVGLAVLHELMEAEVDEVVGPKAGTIATAARYVMATTRARSRSAGGGCRSNGRGRAAPTASTRSSSA